MASILWLLERLSRSYQGKHWEEILNIEQLKPETVFTSCSEIDMRINCALHERSANLMPFFAPVSMLNNALFYQILKSRNASIYVKDIAKIGA